MKTKAYELRVEFENEGPYGELHRYENESQMHATLSDIFTVLGEENLTDMKNITIKKIEFEEWE